MNILLVGVGGQGIATTARILANAAIASKMMVKGLELVGGAQRGGTVVSHVRIGEDQYSPVIPPGNADVILGFEPLETLRLGLQIVKNNGLVIVNTYIVRPLTVVLGKDKYPDIDKLIAPFYNITRNVHTLNATTIAKNLGAPAVTGTVMLGYLSAVVKKIPYEAFVKGIHATLKDEKIIKINLEALDAGRKAAERMLSSGDRS